MLYKPVLFYYYRGEKRKPGSEQPPDTYLQKKIKVEPGLEDGTAGGESKSVLELLELEMRARIIKTMLEKGDEGKKITEDAIVAVIQSAKKITGEGVDAGRASKEVVGIAADSKDDSRGRKSDREAEGEAVEERSRGRRRGEGRRSERRRHHDQGHEGKKSSSTRSQKRDGSYSEDGSRGRSSRKQRESNSSKKRVAKKKITRQEFVERMKRAKKNRTYRQRKSSEDEDKTKDNENRMENTKEDKDEKTEDKTDKKQDTSLEGKSIEAKTEGEVSEKEEGEIDSNEEEEGACSPSEISSDSKYSSSGSSSRSWSRSCSRSHSKSPYRGRQRRDRRRSRSRSRRRRRSYSRSYSRSRTPDRRRSKGDQRSFERKNRESPKSNNKKDVKKTSPEDISPSREEDWGHKCDIEFVDSEEDFDDSSEATKKESGAQKTLPVIRTERASISFSLQKKPVGIAQNVDLDDLPLKKNPTSTMTDNANDVETLAGVKPTIRSEEIVISSDSEGELEPSKQKTLTKPKEDGKKQSEQQLPIANESKKEDLNLQSDQENQIKQTDDSEINDEKVIEGMNEMNNEGSVKVTSLQETCTDLKNNDETKITGNVSSKNNETGKEKQAVETIDKVVTVNKGESPNDSESTDDSESEDSDNDNTLEKLNTDNGEFDKNEQMKNIEKLSTDSAERIDIDSIENCKEKGIDNLDKEKTLNIDRAESQTSRENLEDDNLGIRERRTTQSELQVDIEQTLDIETKQNIEEGINVRDKSSIEALEEEEQDIEAETKQKVEMKTRDASVCLETEEKNKSLTTNDQKDVELDSKEAGSVFESQTEEEEEQLKSSEDEDGKGMHKDKTPVEPFRIETRRITRRQLKTSQKIEMVMPEKSWMKKDRKKRGKAKNLIGVERNSILKSTQSEDAHIPSQESEVEAETSQNVRTQEVAENEEIPIHSPALISDTENSQPAEEPIGEKPPCPSPKQDLPEVSHTEEKTLRKSDHDTEIIGVIETSKDTSDNFDDMELGGSSWSMRWLQSEKVQKVVTSSKMLSRVRKKIQRKEKATKVVVAEKVEEAQKPTEPVISVIGSIEEYERLFGTRVKKDEGAVAGVSESQDMVGEGQVAGSISQTQDDIPEPIVKGNPVFGSDDDGEDSEEEALWSKIIKK